MQEYYQIIEVEDDIYRITSRENVFMELLVGTERAMLIDTGYGYGDLASVVRQLTDKPLVIVNTHGHMDHTCGNFLFKEPVYIASEDLALMAGNNSPASRKHWVEIARHSVDYATGRECNALPENFDEEAYLQGGCQNYRILTDGMEFDLGGKHLRAVHTPGHTRGSMSFLYTERNWLYVGDAANIFFWLFGKDATDRATYIRTLDRIKELAPVRLYGGHAPQPYGADDLCMFKRAATEADYDRGIPFTTPILSDSKDVRVCILDGKEMQDIGRPGFYAILLDEARR